MWLLLSPGCDVIVLADSGMPYCGIAVSTILHLICCLGSLSIEHLYQSVLKLIHPYYCQSGNIAGFPSCIFNVHKWKKLKCFSCSSRLLDFCKLHYYWWPLRSLLSLTVWICGNALQQIIHEIKKKSSNITWSQSVEFVKVSLWTWCLRRPKQSHNCQYCFLFWYICEVWNLVEFLQNTHCLK